MQEETDYHRAASKRPGASLAASGWRLLLCSKRFDFIDSSASSCCSRRSVGLKGSQPAQPVHIRQ